MSELGRSFPSLVVYAAGMVCLLACDFMATAVLDVESMALWSRVRSIFYFYPALLLCGLDQVVVRLPRRAPLILRHLRWHILLGSALAAVLLDALSYLDWKLGVATALASTLSAAGFQLNRALDGRTRAQVLCQGWKILLALVFVFLLIARPNLTFATVLTSAFSAAALASSGILWRSIRLRRSVISDSFQYVFGYRFVITGSLLAASTYGELLLINFIAAPTLASSYFAHLTYFTLPATALAGYLAFILVPLGRRKAVDLPRMASLRVPWFLAGAFGLVIIGQILGLISWNLIKPAVGVRYDHLAALLACAAFLRLLYVPISAYAATYGSIALQDQLIRSQVAAIMLTGIGFLILLVGVGGDVRILVAISANLHLVLRIAFMRHCVVNDWKLRHSELGAKLSDA